jgi:hypothetical protein
MAISITVSLPVTWRFKCDQPVAQLILPPVNRKRKSMFGHCAPRALS